MQLMKQSDTRGHSYLETGSYQTECLRMEKLASLDIDLLFGTSWLVAQL